MLSYLVIDDDIFLLFCIFLTTQQEFGIFLSGSLTYVGLYGGRRKLINFHEPS
jgi:hypothetical protein